MSFGVHGKMAHVFTLNQSINDELWEQIEYILNNDQKSQSNPSDIHSSNAPEIVSEEWLYDSAHTSRDFLSALKLRM